MAAFGKAIRTWLPMGFGGILLWQGSDFHPCNPSWLCCGILWYRIRTPKQKAASKAKKDKGQHVSKTSALWYEWGGWFGVARFLIFKMWDVFYVFLHTLGSVFLKSAKRKITPQNKTVPNQSIAQTSVTSTVAPCGHFWIWGLPSSYAFKAILAGWWLCWQRFAQRGPGWMLVPANGPYSYQGVILVFCAVAVATKWLAGLGTPKIVWSSVGGLKS